MCNWDRGGSRTLAGQKGVARAAPLAVGLAAELLLPAEVAADPCHGHIRSWCGQVESLVTAAAVQHMTKVTNGELSLRSRSMCRQCLPRTQSLCMGMVRPCKSALVGHRTRHRVVDGAAALAVAAARAHERRPAPVLLRGHHALGQRDAPCAQPQLSCPTACTCSYPAPAATLG